MQFQVPQFIEVEDKIVGPLTFKQFVYLAGGAGGAFLFYRTLPLIAAVPLILVVAGLAIALAFYKVNNKPFVATLEAATKYFLSGRLYLWKKELPDASASPVAKAAVPTTVPRMSESKLRDLAWSLDVESKGGS